MGELNRISEKIRRRVIADGGRIAAQEAHQLLGKFLRIVESGLTGGGLQQRGDARDERFLEIHEFTERPVGEGNICLKDRSAAEEIEPRAKLIQETDNALRREQIEVQKLLKVFCSENRGWVGEHVRIGDANRGLRAAARHILSTNRGDHGEDHVESAGRRVQINHIAGQQLGERDAIRGVVVGIVERSRQRCGEVHRAILHAGAEESGGDAEVEIVERADPAAEVQLADPNEEGLRRRQSRREINPHCEVEIQKRGQIELRGGIHTETKAAGIHAEVEGQRGRPGPVEIKIQ